ncbi:hypothetical protein YC2023_011653 [Brassica napus]
MSLSASPVPQTGVPGVRHSTLESLRLGPSSQSIVSSLLRFWDSLNFKKDSEFMGITVLFLDEKVARCSSMYKITDHLFLIRFISPTIIEEVITVLLRSISSHDRLFDNLKMWLDKSVLSRALTLPKKQLKSLFVSSLICKK